MLNILILITSFAASLSTYHQIFRVYKNQSSKDISFIHVTSVFFNMITHLCYAVDISNQNLVITFANGTVATFLLLFIAIYFSPLKEYVKSKCCSNSYIQEHDHELVES